MLLCAPTAAQTPPKQQAHEAYQAGKKAFLAGDYDRALERFEYAYMLDNAPTLLYNLGRAAEEAGYRGKTLRYFELYLARNPDADDRADVEARMRSAQAGHPTRALQQVEAHGAGTHLAGWSTLAAGAVVTGVGAWFFVDALDAADRAETLFPTETTRRAELEDQVARSELIGWVGLGAGVAAMGVGAALLLGDDSGGPVSVGVRPGGAQVRLRW
jgi:tetratricopeptide (TPR) repeat protein